jgi:hypothetical protein
MDFFDWRCVPLAIASLLLAFALFWLCDFGAATSRGDVVGMDEASKE